MLRVADLEADDRAPAPLASADVRRLIGDRLPARHFLLVTGPFGPFSTLLATRLRAAGARCTRILLNGGDIVDWGLGQAAAYAGPRSGWGAWIDAYLRLETVSDLIVFGDSHPYCAAAIEEARRQNIRIHVLEEGYFRPHWITLEREGVNGCSGLPRDPEAYRRGAARQAPAEPASFGPAHGALSLRVFLYFFGFYAGRPFFRGFHQPYPYSPLRQGLAHTRKYLARRMQALVGGKPRQSVPPRYFLVLLQRPGDSQIVRHSPFRTVGDMVEQVMISFARHAPPAARLVIKAHPLDHGIERHDRQIEQLSDALGVAGRVTFIDDTPLDGLLGQADGVVTVNSTGGLTSIELGKPTVALGSAIYDLPGLAYQGGLDAFWSSPEAPDPGLFQAFKRAVIAQTQVNGAFASAKGARVAAEGVAARILAD